MAAGGRTCSCTCCGHDACGSSQSESTYPQNCAPIYIIQYHRSSSYTHQLVQAGRRRRRLGRTWPRVAREDDEYAGQARIREQSIYRSAHLLLRSWNGKFAKRAITSSILVIMASDRSSSPEIHTHESKHKHHQCLSTRDVHNPIAFFFFCTYPLNRNRWSKRALALPRSSRLCFAKTLQLHMKKPWC